MSFLKAILLLSLQLAATGVYALAPKSEFIQTASFGEITSYELKGKGIEINGMSSDFSYDDLTAKETEQLNKLIVTKQEYGKIFGFADWKTTGQKIVEKNSERVFLIQGTYKDAQHHIVNFIEVYWATKNKSGQYLITSNSVSLKLEKYTEYLQ
jgi:hypothetical protein